MSGVRTAAAVLLLVGTGALARASYVAESGHWHGESALPLTIGQWQGVDAGPLSADVAQVVQADGLVNRVYQAETGAVAGLYVAYYERQRPGVSIHSPLHCLPGTGWEVEMSQPIALATAAGFVGQGRKLIVQKQRSRALVVYWYSVHDRVLNSEVASRLYLLNDQLRIGRNDAALVRIVVPLSLSEVSAEQTALAFAHDLFPHLPQLWD